MKGLSSSWVLIDFKGKKLSFIAVVISKNLSTLSFIQGVFNSDDQLYSLIYCSNTCSDENFKARTFIRFDFSLCFVCSCDDHIILQWSEVPIRANIRGV